MKTDSKFRLGREQILYSSQCKAVENTMIFAIKLVHSIQMCIYNNIPPRNENHPHGIGIPIDFLFFLSFFSGAQQEKFELIILLHDYDCSFQQTLKAPQKKSIKLVHFIPILLKPHDRFMWWTAWNCWSSVTAVTRLSWTEELGQHFPKATKAQEPFRQWHQWALRLTYDAFVKL